MFRRINTSITKLIKGLILPLVVLLQWDYTNPSQPEIIIQGFIIERSIQGGAFSTWQTINDAGARSITDGSLTSGIIAQYRIKAFGTINTVPSESSISSSISITNTTNAPLSPGGPGNPGGGGAAQPIYR